MHDDSLAEEPRHPIGVAAHRTGLSPDVIRVWERRYGAVRPARGAGGQRAYSDADIERLRLLHAVTEAGRSIGQVAALPTAELAELAAGDTASTVSGRPATAAGTETAQLLDEALALTVALEAERLDATLRRAAAVLGTGRFIEEVVAPLLRRVGNDWHAGRLGVAHEHLVSSVLHDIVNDTMRGLTPRPGGPRLVIATPAGERHVIGAAAVGAIAAAEGWNVVYLGADLPAADIGAAAAAPAVRLVAVSIVNLAARDELLAEMRELRRSVPASIPVWAGGVGAELLAGELAALGIRAGESLEILRQELRAAAD